ncbi:hypothetical protein ACH5RR_009879 [Cinchona calisaya]|uniref:Uncharacterized protein n=1 Tax=Cinchona calisaya TaxID=153742 RepID=A0ABD3AHQ9_9GENT
MASESNRNGSTLVVLPRLSVPKVLWMADLRSTALPNWNRMGISENIITQNRAQSLTRLLKSLSNAYYLGDEIPITFNMDSKVDEPTLKLVNSFNWQHGPKILRRRIIQEGLILAVSEIFFPKQWREFYVYMNMRFTEDAKQNPVQIPKSRTNGWQASWKKFLIDMIYLRGYVSLYPNFPDQASFSTNHMEPGAHISAKDNVVRHDKSDFEVPLLNEDFKNFLPNGKLPPASKLPSLNLFNQSVSLKGLKAAGAKLGQDVLGCNPTEGYLRIARDFNITILLLDWEKIDHGIS